MATSENANSVNRSFVLQLQQNNEWCDITLFATDSPASYGIKGHKLVLAAASPHLREAFKSEGFIDSGGKGYHVDMINHATLQLIVDFIYAGKLELAGDNVGDRLKSVLMGADYLMMPELKQICAKDLESYLDIDCGFNMWVFARKYKSKPLEEAAVRAMACDLRAIAAQDAFLDVKKSDAVDLLKSLATIVPAANADHVCEAALAWIAYIRPTRDADCDEITRQIPLHAMSARALQRVSEVDFLPAQILWAVDQARQIRIKADELELDKVKLLANLKLVIEGCANDQQVSEKRRSHLTKMISQAEYLEKRDAVKSNRVQLDQLDSQQFYNWMKTRNGREVARMRARKFASKKPSGPESRR